MKKITILKYYLYCLKVGVCTTAQAISAKFNQFIEERGLDWTKCKSVTTDGAAAMQGSTNGVVWNIKIVSLDCVSTHCMVHEKLMEENNQRSGLEIVVDAVIEIVNLICSHSKKHWMLLELLKHMEVEAMRLLYHAEVRWLSRGNVLKQVLQLRQELQVFLAEDEHTMSTSFIDNFWLGKLSYFSAIFQSTNRLNLLLQG